MQKVKPGDELSIKASDWNKIADVVNNHTMRTGRSTSSNNSNTYITISNTTEDTIPIYGIAEIDGLAIDPIIRANTYQEPIFKAIKPVAHNVRVWYVVAQEPIPAGHIGTAMISGITTVRTSYSPADMQYVRPSYSGFGGTATYTRTQMRIIAPSMQQGYHVIHIAPDVPDAIIPAKIVRAIDDVGFYEVRLFENGYNSAGTAIAVMYLPEASYGHSLRAGQAIMVYRQDCRYINAEIVTGA